MLEHYRKSVKISRLWTGFIGCIQFVYFLGLVYFIMKGMWFDVFVWILCLGVNTWSLRRSVKTLTHYENMLLYYEGDHV